MSEVSKQKEINEHLRSYGYNLMYSFDQDACAKAQMGHLGKGACRKFWNKVYQFADENESSKVENYMRSLIGNDAKYLKILLSSQIAISVEILQQIIAKINDRFSKGETLNILELGGYDGWAADYLNQKLNLPSKIDVVDLDSKFQSKNENVLLIEDGYSTYRSNTKYDVVFSILGAPGDDIADLISCLTSNIKDKGMAYLGLRVQPDDYATFVQLFSNHKLFQTSETVSTVAVEMSHGRETLPVFSLEYRN